MMKSISKSLIEAAKDYKYLLNRGYPQKASLDLVTSRYRLSKYERLLLYRCVHSDEICNIVKSKRVDPNDVYNRLLIIDGYNVLLTILTGIKGEPLYLCDDGFIRDLRGAQPRSCEYKLLVRATELIKEHIKSGNSRKVLLSNFASYAVRKTGVNIVLTSNNIPATLGLKYNFFPKTKPIIGIK